MRNTMFEISFLLSKFGTLVHLLQDIQHKRKNMFLFLFLDTRKNYAEHFLGSFLKNEYKKITLKICPQLDIINVSIFWLLAYSDPQLDRLNVSISWLLVYSDPQLDRLNVSITWLLAYQDPQLDRLNVSIFWLLAYLDPQLDRF